MTDGEGKPPGKLDSFLTEDDLADIEDIFDAYVAERAESTPRQRSTPQAPRPIAPPDAFDRSRRGASRTVHGLQGFSVEETPSPGGKLQRRDDGDSPTGTHMTHAAPRPAAAQSVATGKFSVPTGPGTQDTPASSTQSTGIRRTLMAAAPAIEDDDDPFQQRVPTGLNRARSSSTISGGGIHQELDKALAEQNAIARKQPDDDEWDTDVSSFSRSPLTGAEKSGGSAVLRRPGRKAESPRQVTARTSANHPALASSPQSPSTRPNPAIPDRERRAMGPGSTLMFGQADVDELVATREASAADTSPVGTDVSADTSPVGRSRPVEDRSARETSPTNSGSSAEAATPDDYAARAFSSSLQAELDALGDDQDSAFDEALSLDGEIATGFQAPAGRSLHAEAELVIDDSDGDSASTDEEFGHPAESTRVATFDQESGVLAPDLAASGLGDPGEETPSGDHALDDAFSARSDTGESDEAGAFEEQTRVAATALIAGNSAELDAFAEPDQDALDALNDGPSLDVEEVAARAAETVRSSALGSRGEEARSRRPVPRSASPTLDIEDARPARPTRQRDTAYLDAPKSSRDRGRGGSASPLGPLLVMVVQAAVIGGALYWLGFFAP